MKIAIIGGGITGLCTALALKRLEIDCTVFESHFELRAEGAGILMQPNALKVFEFLGIKNEVVNSGVVLNGVKIIDGKSLKAYSKINAQFVQDEENLIVSIHRATLLQNLYSRLPSNTVKFNKRLERLHQANNEVVIEFEDGGKETFSIVLGADGIHSNVRKTNFKNTSLRYSGQTCWRGVADINLNKEFFATGNEAWLNNKRFGFSNIAANKVYWFAVEKAPENETEDTKKVRENLLNKFSDFHPMISEIIGATENEKIIRNDISDLRRLEFWSQENICLLGDAGHATTPNMGQGACQGIEDAYYIAHYLKESKTPNDAFQKFERKRRKKVDYIVNNSWQFGKMAHHNIGSKLSILAMKILPASIMINELEKVYHLEKK